MATAPVRIRLRTSARITPGRVVGWFALAGLLWIWLTDRALVWTGLQDDIGFIASAGKGSIFVLLSAAFLYWLVRREMRALADAEALLRAVVDSTSDAVFAKDAGGQYLVFNEAAARFVGKPAAEVLGHDDTFLFDRFGAELVMNRDRRVMATGQEETEEETVTADGVTRTYLTTKAPLRDAGGRTVGVIGFSRDITDHKRAEEEVRRYAALHGAIVGSAWEGICACHEVPHEPFVEMSVWNDRMAELTGYTLAEINRLGWYQAMYPDPAVRERAAARMARMREGDDLRGELWEITRKDGQRRTVSITTSGIRPASGTPSVVAFFQDVTDRAAAEDAVRASERRFRELADAIPQIVWAAGADGGLTHLNAKAAEYSGLGTDVLLGWSWDKVIHPDDLPAAVAEWTAVLTSGVPRDIEFRIRRTDGEHRWHVSRQTPSRGPDGAVVGWYGTCTDIEDIRRAHAALGESETRLRLALSAAKLGAWDWDFRTGRVHRSDECRAILGVEVLDADAATFERALHPDDAGNVMAALHRAAAEGGPFAEVFRVVHPDGRVRWVSDEGQCLRDEAGTPARMIGVMRDITGRVQGEDDLRRSVSLLQATLNATADGVLVVDMDGRIVDLNRQFATLWNLPPEFTAAGRKEDLVAAFRSDGAMAAVFGQLADPQGFAERVAEVYRTPEKPSFDVVTFRDGRILERYSEPQLVNGLPVGRVWSFRDVTERRRAEAAVRESERRLRLALEAARMGVWEWEVASGAVYWSPECTAVTGHPATATTLADFTSLVHPDDVDRVMAAARQAVESRETFAAEFRAVQPDGDVRWLANLARAEYATDGRPLRMVGTVQDVTARVRAEASLRESEGRLRLFVEHAPAALAMFDRDMRYVVASRRWMSDYRLLGVDLVGRSHYDLFPQISSEWRAVHARALAGEVLRADRDHFRRADGSVQWLRWEVRPWLDAAGEVAGIVMFADDITDRVEAEAAVRASEEQFRGAFDHSAVAMVLTDLDNRFTRVNEAFARLFGYSPAEMLALTMADITHPDHLAESYANREPLLAGRADHFVMEKRYHHRNGRELWGLTNVSLVRDADGRPHHYVGQVQDITARKQAEAALRESEERFRALVENGYEGINILNADGWSVYSSPRNAALVGLSPGEVDDDTFGFVHPDDRDRAQATIAEIATEPGREIELRLRLLRKDGASFWVEAHARNLFDHPAVRGIVVNWRDITDRVRAEAALDRRRVLLERIAGGRVELADLLAQIGDLVEDEIADSLCSVLLLDGGGRLRVGAARHLPAEYNAAIDGVAIGPAVGSCGTAAHFGRTVVVADIAADPLWADYRAAALPHGLRACWSVPIPAAHATGGGPVLGTFALYRTRPSEPTADEMAVLHAAAQLAGIAVERVRAEAALRESEARFRRLMEVLPVSVHVIDGGRLTYCNPACLALFGAAAEGELHGKTPFELVHPDYHGPVRDRIAALRQSPDRVPFVVVKVMRLDGQPRTVHAVATPMRGAHPDAHLVCLNDVTEQERSNALLRSVLGSVADAILTIDARGTVQSANPAAVRASGYAEDEMVGRNVRQLMPEPYYSAHDEYIAAYLRTGEAKVIGIGREVEARRKDGTTFPVELTVTEFEFDGARHFTGVLRDISVRRRLEAQLRQAQKMEAIGRLAGGVAHDFNNLLTVINGYCDLLLMGLPAGDPNRASVAAVLDAGERAARLTQQLLAFSRKAVVEPKVLDLNELVAQAGRLLRSLIGEDILLAVVTDPTLGPVKADPGQLEQVILNLAVNARDAMPTGGRLTIETRAATLGPGDLAVPHRRPGRYACLRVTDTGCGMTDAVKANIFEPFFTTKGVGKGTGLGLAVVHGVVEGCGGLVEVESAVGVGTTFAVSLPVVEAAGKAAGGPSPVAVTGGAETVLLVEDEDAVRTIARLALEMHGYTVLEAAGGAEAARLADTHPGPIHLLVSDVVMPEMGGRQLLERLRRTRPALRVLFMSGYTDDAVLLHGVVESRDSFIQKPFAPLALARKVRAVIDAGKADGT